MIILRNKFQRERYYTLHEYVSCTSYYYLPLVHTDSSISFHAVQLHTVRIMDGFVSGIFLFLSSHTRRVKESRTANRTLQSFRNLFNTHHHILLPHPADG